MKQIAALLAVLLLICTLAFHGGRGDGIEGLGRSDLNSRSSGEDSSPRIPIVRLGPLRLSVLSVLVPRGPLDGAVLRCEISGAWISSSVEGRSFCWVRSYQERLVSWRHSSWGVGDKLCVAGGVESVYEFLPKSSVELSIRSEVGMVVAVTLMGEEASSGMVGLSERQFEACESDYCLQTKFSGLSPGHYTARVVAGLHVAEQEIFIQLNGQHEVYDIYLARSTKQPDPEVVRGVVYSDGVPLGFATFRIRYESVRDNYSFEGMIQTDSSGGFGCSEPYRLSIGSRVVLYSHEFGAGEAVLEARGGEWWAEVELDYSCREILIIDQAGNPVEGVEVRSSVSGMVVTSKTGARGEARVCGEELAITYVELSAGGVKRRRMTGLDSLSEVQLEGVAVSCLLAQGT